MRIISWGPGSATAVFGQVAFCHLWRPDRTRHWRGLSSWGPFAVAPSLLMYVPTEDSVPDSGTTEASGGGHPNFLLPPSGRAPWERHADTHLLWDPHGLQGWRRNFRREENKSDPQSLRPQPQGHFSGKCLPHNPTLSPPSFLEPVEHSGLRRAFALILGLSLPVRPTLSRFLPRGPCGNAVEPQTLAEWSQSAWCSPGCHFRVWESKAQSSKMTYPGSHKLLESGKAKSWQTSAALVFLLF